MRCYLCFSDPHFFPRLSQLQHVCGAHPCGWGGLFPGGHGGGGMAVWLRSQAVCTRNPAPAQHHVYGTWSPARMTASQAASHLWKHAVALSQLSVSLPDLYHLLCLYTPWTSRLENLHLHGHKQSHSPEQAKRWSVPEFVVNNTACCKFLPMVFK